MFGPGSRIQISHGPPREHKPKPEHIEQLMEMGFSKSQCKAALKKNHNKVDRALDKLLQNPDQFIGVGSDDDDDESAL